jgi:hypothetical protein
MWSRNGNRLGQSDKRAIFYAVSMYTRAASIRRKSPRSQASHERRDVVDVSRRASRPGKIDFYSSIPSIRCDFHVLKPSRSTSTMAETTNTDCAMVAGGREMPVAATGSDVCFICTAYIPV